MRILLALILTAILPACASAPEPSRSAAPGSDMDCFYRWERAVTTGESLCFERTAKQCEDRDWERISEREQCWRHLHASCRSIAEDYFTETVYTPCREAK